ncbi:MAG: Fe-S oxidoreductase, partial [Flavobacteriaceae bacterium]|nr:Fe-S oxidoreductase [Flavobacteriaceae bacterium]
MQYIDNILFVIVLAAGLAFFAKNVKKLIRNIKLGKKVDRSDNTSARWANMTRIALGQGKMVRRPVAGILHIIVYLGFIIINIEVLEIVVDGIAGTHRAFSGMGAFYGFLIASFEILAVLVLVSVIIFWIRRNVIKLQRFVKDEMKGWPKSDGNWILYFEIILMSLFLIMNATDVPFQEMNSGNVISSHLAGFFNGMAPETLHVIERGAWWLHIVG